MADAHVHSNEETRAFQCPAPGRDAPATLNFVHGKVDLGTRSIAMQLAASPRRPNDFCIRPPGTEGHRLRKEVEEDGVETEKRKERRKCFGREERRPRGEVCSRRAGLSTHRLARTRTRAAAMFFLFNGRQRFLLEDKERIPDIGYQHGHLEISDYPRSPGLPAALSGGPPAKKEEEAGAGARTRYLVWKKPGLHVLEARSAVWHGSRKGRSAGGGQVFQPDNPAAPIF
ncbi:hypothetical protein KM043_008937 [Ampulex compressa]|nr:hypothetical protein KM043_008937 [Ampulex compressa]